jgi:flavin-dependent dehydrogenase
MTSVPKRSRILVVGGGPAGSTAATLLAKQGYEVTLFERAFFPRYHIGESLLPSVLQILDVLGAREKMEQFGFTKKEGAYLEWGAEAWGLNFGELGGNCTYAFQVERADFDNLLLEHARSEGVTVFEGMEVQGLTFDGERPRAAQWTQRSRPAATGNGNGKWHGDGHHTAGLGVGEVVAQGEIAFDYLIDASGRAGVMAKYLQNRKYHKVFQNVAIWGYWEGADRMATGREGDIAVGSIPNGWLWAIPLRDGTMSVGVVMHRDNVVAKKGASLEQLYAEAIDETPFIKAIVEPGTLVSKMYTEQDYSYAAQRFCGPGYYMIGDAACFLDPLLSSGVHLATYSGLLAAASIGSTIRGEVEETASQAFFEKCYRQAYLRFLVFLSAFYDVGRKKESYFWEAQQLTEEDVNSGDLRLAFLNLVTGVKDMKDVQTNAHATVLETMAKRIDENLRFRKDKHELASLEGERKDQARANARFFSSVEGLFALDKAEAVDGLYVATTPYVHLAKVADHEHRAPTAPEELFEGIDMNTAMAAGAIVG